MGYVVTQGDGGCELQQIDLTTGVLTDLPAAASDAACAVDLAVAPNGVVHGIAGGEIDDPQLVTYAADGTPTLTPITVAGADNVWMATGGIAVSAAGTVYVHLVVSMPGCDTGTTPVTSAGTPLYEGDSVCLFTVDAGTGAATLIGTTDLFETVFLQLTSCASTLRTIFATEGFAGLQWATESAATGAATPGPAVDQPLAGYDCASTGDTLYAVTGTAMINLGSNTPAAGEIPGCGHGEHLDRRVHRERRAERSPGRRHWHCGATPTAAPTDPDDHRRAANAAEIAPAFTG